MPKLSSTHKTPHFRNMCFSPTRLACGVLTVTKGYRLGLAERAVPPSCRDRFPQRSWYQVLGTQDLGTKIWVPRSWYQDLGTKILVPRSWYQDLGTKILVPRCWYQDLGTYHFLGKGETHNHLSGQGFRTVRLITGQRIP